ncbi:hypothetical protein TL16_g01852 [Triparma laevis f. inornata]|uniref:Uncharacterized protein n=2 Tax=Triparma laevis TaxID=1534972 RepID=A0A9W7CGY3_9STRA|nr:hypothetical protein TL16_g01852 [Triparma laevis f. inornata]GMI04499.1 hypothetical protein TrLO_g15464 [Triparma laevis f. longispina]
MSLPSIAKPVISRTADGQARKFTSLTAAERLTGVNRKKISKILSSSSPESIDGLTWEFASPSDPLPFESESTSTSSKSQKQLNPPFQNSIETRKTIQTKTKKKKPQFYLSSDSENEGDHDVWEDVTDNPYKKKVTSYRKRDREEEEDVEEISTYDEGGRRIETWKGKENASRGLMVSRKTVDAALAGEDDGEVKAGTRIRKGSEITINAAALPLPEPKGLPQSLPTNFDASLAPTSKVPPNIRFFPCGHVQLCRTCFSEQSFQVKDFVCSWCKLGVLNVEPVEV